MKKETIKNGKWHRAINKPNNSAASEKYAREFMILDKQDVPIVSDREMGYMLECLTLLFMEKCGQAKEAIEARQCVPPMSVIMNDPSLCQLWAKFLVEGYVTGNRECRDIVIVEEMSFTKNNVNK